MTVYGRQELWEDSPEGWPQRWGAKGGQFRLGGRLASQLSRIRAGRDDDLGPMPDGWTACSCSLSMPVTAPDAEYSGPAAAAVKWDETSCP
jgi:hypothetical protein